MKRWLTYLFAIYFVLQLAVPGYLVYRHYNTLSTGESYKFEVAPYDPYDPFRGRYVALGTAVSLYSYDGDYALLGKDADGYAEIVSWQYDKPTEGQYIKSPRLDRYYMNEKMAPEAERLQRELDVDDDMMYLLVKVKNGHYVIEGLYLNDIPIEQYITA